MPLALGALPYLILRKDVPVFITAMQQLCRNYFEVCFSRSHVLRLDSNWGWVAYNLPDALWAFSLTSFVALTTHTDSRKIKLLYLFMAILIMVGLEITVGTFDWLDIAAMVFGLVASTTILRNELGN